MYLMFPLKAICTQLALIDFLCLVQPTDYILARLTLGVNHLIFDALAA